MRKWKWPVPDPTPVSSIFELWESAADDGEQTEIFISSLLPADSIIERRPQCAWLHAVGEALKKKKSFCWSSAATPQANRGAQRPPNRVTNRGPRFNKISRLGHRNPLYPWTTLRLGDLFLQYVPLEPLWWYDRDSNNNKSYRERRRNVLRLAILAH